MTFSSIFRWNNLRYLLPVIIIKILNKLGILDHICKESILKQMRLIILPLRQSSQTLRRILLFF
jgi:hypothetical protein